MGDNIARYRNAEMPEVHGTKPMSNRPDRLNKCERVFSASSVCRSGCAFQKWNSTDTAERNWDYAALASCLSFFVFELSQFGFPRTLLYRRTISAQTDSETKGPVSDELENRAFDGEVRSCAV